MNEAPFKNGTRVRYNGPLYDRAPQPVLGNVVGWYPLSGHTEVLWDFYQIAPLLEYHRELAPAD